jgi:hypothetical protein
MSWMALAGCMAGYLSEARDIRHPAKASPSQMAKPASGKWEGPWKEYSAMSSLKATFYYGPWQCNRRWMASCQRECAEQGRMLKGCMWLADIKYDWRGPSMPIQAGSRYALWHCCCDFPKLKPADKEPLRKQWENGRAGLRRKFSEIYGEWPMSGGDNWPGHHIHDLWHGGAPTDLENIIPVQPDIHDVFTKQYPQCYAGSAPWNTVGPDLPYQDW